MNADRPTSLPLLWVERDPAKEMLRFVGIDQRLPSWQELMPEMAALQSRVASGIMPWRPLNNDGPANGYKRADAHISHVFANLPSVKAVIHQLADAVEATAYTAEVGNEEALQLIIEFSEQWHSIAMWRHYGRRVFVLDPYTFQLLTQTDLPPLPAQAIQFPLNAFYILFPKGWSLGRGRDANIPAEGALVTIDRTDGSADFERTGKILVSGRNKFQTESSPVVTWEVPMPPDRLLSEVANSETEENDDGESSSDQLEDVPRLILNFCLYLMSEHPRLEPIPPPPRKKLSAIKNPHKRRVEEERQAQRSSLGYIYVGSREDWADAPIEETPEETRSLRHQVWVRGHWRNQAFGEGHAMRRLQWIRPYVKGPDIADQAAIRAARVQPARTVLPKKVEGESLE